MYFYLKRMKEVDNLGRYTMWNVGYILDSEMKVGTRKRRREIQTEFCGELETTNLILPLDKDVTIMFSEGDCFKKSACRASQSNIRPSTQTVSLTAHTSIHSISSTCSRANSTLTGAILLGCHKAACSNCAIVLAGSGSCNTKVW